jgi:nicotinamide mononucleotide transporter
MDALRWLLDAQLQIGDSAILWREIVGNLFGLASALGGMRRRVWAWPVGIVGNVVLFTVFLGAVFDTPGEENLYGQAGRQVFFVAVSVWGWRRWRETRDRVGDAEGHAVTPRWATAGERALVVVLFAAGTVLLSYVLRALDSFGPWTEAWILAGSILATWGMARGWVEFWLVWIAVDLVGVPSLLQAGLYPSAVLYAVYGLFCLLGFVTWLRVERSAPTTATPQEAMA